MEFSIHSRLLVLLSLPLLGAISACSGDAYVVSTDSIDTSPEFDGATLAVHTPASASINHTELGLDLSAELLDIEGNPLEFEDISWTFVGDEEPTFVGNETTLELEPGIYDILVMASTPNGGLLQTTLNGVRVQGERTGVYAGNLEMAAALEFQGTAVNTGCVGGITFEIGMDGEVIEGDGGCSMILVILDPIDVSYSLGGEVDGADAAGDIGLDLGFFELPVGWDGGFEGDVFAASFAGNAVLFEFEGVINATRITEYVNP